MMATRTQINLRSVSVDDLEGLDETEFRSVVDAELRSNDNPAVSAALRGAYADRWHHHLSLMMASVDGQLASREADFEAGLARLNGKLADTERALATHDEPDGFVAKSLRTQLFELRAQIEKNKVKYHEGRAGSLRFRNGVQEALVEAQGLASANRAGKLLEAIREHRRATLAEGIEPNGFDITLWDALTP